MYLIIHLFFCIRLNDVQQLHEEDQDRSKHVKRSYYTLCVKSIIITLVQLLVLLCELFINARA
jgi:hypothetical protein